ncbi:hypothetical protein EDB92DRAFT_1818173 [Lactarius akahatsu]|uniref:Uncharacterized protein n=1 Tax=Lactarius akahatsu TaxID=416441 RepID=A0AAD4LCV4_9AGAM|nr:hypothetical protein EDB92DRAFT_1818173 [Lactarius akahatsu]
MASLHLRPIAALCTLLLLPEATHAVWPQSRNLQTSSSALRFGFSFAIHVAVPNAQKDLLAAAERTRTLIFSDKFGRIVVGRGADDLSAVWRKKALSDLTLRLLGNVSGAPRPIATEATLPLNADFSSGTGTIVVASHSFDGLYDLMHPVMKEVYVMDFVLFHVIPASSRVGGASV